MTLREYILFWQETYDLMIFLLKHQSYKHLNYYSQPY